MTFSLFFLWAPGAVAAEKPSPGWVALESSNVAAVRYVPKTRTLEIRFSRNDIYRFSNVPAQLHAEFVASESPGRFFRTYIQGRFASERIAKGEKRNAVRPDRAR